MNMERIWMQTSEISALAKYIMNIDKGNRNPEPRKRMVERIELLIHRFITEHSAEVQYEEEDG